MAVAIRLWVLLWVVVLLLQGAGVEGKLRRRNSGYDDDDDFCINDDGFRVRAQDCPHHCCTNGTCGDEDTCKLAIAIIIIIVVVCILCVCVCCIVVVMFLTKKGCFSKDEKTSTVEYTGNGQQGYPAPPPQPGQYQQDYAYPPPAGSPYQYPPQQALYGPPPGNAYPAPAGGGGGGGGYPVPNAQY